MFKFIKYKLNYFFKCRKYGHFLKLFPSMDSGNCVNCGMKMVSDEIVSKLVESFEVSAKMKFEEELLKEE